MQKTEVTENECMYFLKKLLIRNSTFRSPKLNGKYNLSNDVFSNRNHGHIFTLFAFTSCTLLLGRYLGSVQALERLQKICFQTFTMSQVVNMTFVQKHKHTFSRNKKRWL